MKYVLRISGVMLIGLGLWLNNFPSRVTVRDIFGLNTYRSQAHEKQIQNTDSKEVPQASPVADVLGSSLEALLSDIDWDLEELLNFDIDILEEDFEQWFSDMSEELGSSPPESSPLPGATPSPSIDPAPTPSITPLPAPSNAPTPTPTPPPMPSSEPSMIPYPSLPALP